MAVIADKAALHAWVDALPDNAEGVVLVEYVDAEGHAWMESSHIGPQTRRADAVYLATSFIARQVSSQEPG
jgi:hypothetical protein